MFCKYELRFVGYFWSDDRWCDRICVRSHVGLENCVVGAVCVEMVEQQCWEVPVGEPRGAVCTNDRDVVEGVVFLDHFFG